MENPNDTPLNTTDNSFETALAPESSVARETATEAGISDGCSDNSDFSDNSDNSDNSEMSERSETSEMSETSDTAPAAEMHATVSFSELLAAVSEAHSRGFSEGQAQVQEQAQKQEQAQAEEQAQAPEESNPGKRTYAPLPDGDTVPGATPAFLSNLRPGFWD